jgi:hypothetical protein
MIQATTEFSIEAYLQTEDNRIDTSVGTSQIRFLVKITNDMDGSSYYVYPTATNIYPRYTRLIFAYNATPDMYLSQVNLKPAGHYKYEVYEVSWVGTPTLTVNTAPATETTVLPVSDANGVVQGIVTKGILNLTDKAGTEQVQYTQREAPASTNYIYYGQ